MVDDRDIQQIKQENEELKNQVHALKEELNTQVGALKTEFHNYVLEKQKEESRRLRTALIWAGTVILGLGSFLWAEIVWPVIKAGGGSK